MELFVADINKTSSIYLNVELKATARGLFSLYKVFEWILSQKNEKTSQLTKGHSWYP
jgi:hypothetical protein